jgi:hypothetical protein
MEKATRQFVKDHKLKHTGKIFFLKYICYIVQLFHKFNNISRKHVRNNNWKILLMKINGNVSHTVKTSPGAVICFIVVG